MKRKKLHQQLKQALYWLPRVLAISLILFLAVFALDVFEFSNWPVPLLMHLIPSMTLSLITALAWKYPQAGGTLFILTGLTAAVFFHSLLLAVPIWIMGGLFLIEKK